MLALFLAWETLQLTLPCVDLLAPPSDSDPCVEDPQQPTICVMPGSSKSKSGVSRYRDFIGCLPINLSKRIMGEWIQWDTGLSIAHRTWETICTPTLHPTGLLDEQSLKVCQKVCRYWQDLAHDILEEMKFRRNFQEQIETILTVGNEKNSIIITIKEQMRHIWMWKNLTIDLDCRSTEVSILSVIPTLTLWKCPYRLVTVVNRTNILTH